MAVTVETDPAVILPDLGVVAGVYTPSLTNVTNVGASTAYVCQYLRVPIAAGGSVVTVSGRVDIDPTSAADLELGISLPVASDLAGGNDLGGTAAARGVKEVGGIIGDAANNRASLMATVADTANRAWGFQFTYRVY